MQPDSSPGEPKRPWSACPKGLPRRRSWDSGTTASLSTDYPDMGSSVWPVDRFSDRKSTYNSDQQSTCNSSSDPVGLLKISSNTSAKQDRRFKYESNNTHYSEASEAPSDLPALVEPALTFGGGGLADLWREMREGFARQRVDLRVDIRREVTRAIEGCMSEVKPERIFEELKGLHTSMVRADTDTRARLVEVRRQVEQTAWQLDNKMATFLQETKRDGPLKMTDLSSLAAAIQEVDASVKESQATLESLVRDSSASVLSAVGEIDLGSVQRRLDELRPVRQEVQEIRKSMIKPVDKCGNVGVDFSEVINKIQKQTADLKADLKSEVIDKIQKQTEDLKSFRISTVNSGAGVDTTSVLAAIGDLGLRVARSMDPGVALRELLSEDTELPEGLRQLRKTIATAEMRSSGLGESSHSAVQAVLKVRDIERRGSVCVDLRTGDVELLRGIDFNPCRAEGDPVSARFLDDCAAESVLQDLVELLEIFPVPLVVEGHTKHAHGDHKYWASLALKRAELVTERLKIMGVPKDLMKSVGLPGIRGRNRPCVHVRLDVHHYSFFKFFGLYYSNLVGRAAIGA